MHELPIIKGVLDIALGHAEEEKASQILEVVISFGEVHDLIPALVQKYFRYASRGTKAEEATLTMHVLPIICQCEQCGERFVFHLRQGVPTEECPICHSENYKMLSGDEFFIDNIKIR